MHDLELARLIHEDREREIARNLRVYAVRVAQKDRDGAFVPGHPTRPATLAGALRLMPTERRST